MQCPQCRAEVPDDSLNCPSCQINLYWATKHYEELAEIRARQGLSPKASTPAFLEAVHQEAVDGRVARGEAAPAKARVRKPRPAPPA